MTVIEEGIVSYLQGTVGMTALISTRVYAFGIPQGATLPCLTVQRISTPRIMAHDVAGATGTLANPRFQFDAWATTYASAKAISDALRAALNGKTGSTGGVTIRAALVDAEEAELDPQTHLYRSRSDYIVWHEE